ncbi:MAG: hypothetical protein M5U28_22360 [Sandaracinaceae bacterium]|nr:hypothetical protein [Sandaracinaceae bacterium]
MRRARPALAALLLLAALAPADVLATGEDEAAPTFRYRVRSDPEVQRLRVEVCFEGAPPLALVPGIDAAAHALTDARDAGRRPLPVRGGRVDLRSLPAGACMSYGVDLDEARRASRFSGRFARDVMTSAGAWLWRPARIRGAAPPCASSSRAACPPPRRGRASEASTGSTPARSSARPSRPSAASPHRPTRASKRSSRSCASARDGSSTTPACGAGSIAWSTA